jgi:hypothetical protein
MFFQFATLHALLCCLHVERWNSMLRSLAQLSNSDFHEDQQLEALQLLQFAEGRLRPVKGRAKGKSKRQKVAHSVITVVNWVSSEQSTTAV